MVLEENKKEISERIKANFSKEDLISIDESCDKLRTIKTKDNEDRKDYVNVFEEFFPIYRKLVETGEAIAVEISSDSEDGLTAIRVEFVEQIRALQEGIGLTSKLLNVVKYSMIKTIINWINNPDKLEIKSVYKPRSKTKKKRKKFSIDRPNIDFTIQKREKKEREWVIAAEIINNSNYPLQNLEIELLDENEKEIRIIDASGYLIELAKGKINVSFIASSMGNEASLKFWFKALENEPLGESFIVNISQDYPIAQERITDVFTVE